MTPLQRFIGLDVGIGPVPAKVHFPTNCIKAFLIAQSLNQLDKHYTTTNSILDNCHVRVCYASNDDRTAKRISDLLGQATVFKQQESFSGNRSAFRLHHKSVSDQEVGRPLLTPGEINTLSQGKLFIDELPKDVFLTEEDFLKEE